MTVIKRTRLKFFFVMAGIIFAIVFAFCASILITTYVRNNTTTKTTLERMIEEFDLPAGSHDLPGIVRLNNVRGFAVKLNPDFEITAIKSADVFFNTETISQCIAVVKQSGKGSGKINDLEFLVKNTKDGKILAGLDVSMEDAMFSELLATVLFAGGGGMLVLLVLVWFLSKWIIKPTAAAFEKQKLFISEAGHEMKTPLSVISASVELLQKSDNKADTKKWLEVVKQQTEKMSVMTTELLTLSKLDETGKAIKTEFDLSQTVLMEVLAFESVAFEAGKKLLCDTDGGLMYKGEQFAVRQAVGILCDNAIKHSVPDCTIEVKLKKQAAKIVLSVSSAGSAIKEEELPLLFERFYRGSESRAENSGAGLGLSILKTLADKNGWKLNVTSAQEKITFSIAF